MSINFHYQTWITRKDLRQNPNVLFVFGDNMQRVGLGGQAKEMRGEPNAHGIATKRLPAISENSFFSDQLDEFQVVINDTFKLINRYHQENFEALIWPEAGIGTGLAELSIRSPRIYQLLEHFEIGLYKGI